MFRSFMGGLWGSVFLLTGALVACGSSNEGSPPAGGGGAPGTGEGGKAGSAAAGSPTTNSGGGGASSGGVGGSSGGAGGVAGGAAGMAGSAAAGAGGSVQIPMFVSSPVQTLVTHAVSGGEGLILLTSQVRQKIGSTLNYVDWFGEVLNNSQTTRCFIKLDGNFQDSSGTSVQKVSTYAYTNAYQVTGSSLSASCLAPGEKGIVWGNDLPATPINLEAIDKLDLTIGSLEIKDAIAHPLAPKVSALSKTQNSFDKSWAVSGTATAASSTIYNLSLSLWAKSGAFYVDTQKVYHLANFAPGSTWSFDTAPLGLKAAVLDGVTYTPSFIEGSNAAAKQAGDNTPSSELAEAASLAQGVQEQASLRRERWLAN